MKQIFVVLVSCLSVALGEDGKVPFVSTGAKINILSKYVRDGELVHDKPVAQTDLTFTHKSGVYVGVMHSVGIDGTGLNSDFGDELGPYIGWSGEIQKFIVDVGLVYYDFYPLMDRLNDAYGPYVEIGRPFKLNDKHTVTPFVKDESYVMSGEADFEGGNYIFFGLKHAWEISTKVSFEQEASVIQSDGAFGGIPGFSWQYAGSLNLKLNKAITISAPSVQFSAPITSRNEQFHAVFGAGVTFAF